MDGIFITSTAAIQHYLKQQKREKAMAVMRTLTSYWFSYKGSVLDSENRLLQFAKNSDRPRVKSLYTRLIDVKQKVAERHQQAPIPNQGSTTKQALENLADQRLQIEQAITRLDPNFSRDQYLTQLTKEQLDKTLKSNELYIDFAQVSGAYFQFTVDNAWVRFNSFDKNKSLQINNAIERLQRDIKAITQDKLPPESRQAATKAAMAALYPIFMSAIQPHLKGKDTLIISPDGPLRLLPFEALYDAKTGKYLIEKYNIRYVASAKEQLRLHLNQQDKTPTRQSSAVFANPNYNYDPSAVGQAKSGALLASFKQKASPEVHKKEGQRSASNFTNKFDPLTHTQTEADNIIPLLRKAKKQVDPFLNNEATEGQLLSVKSPEILHIATHGFFNNTQTDPMMQSGLVLASANTSIERNDHEGIVYALDLSGLDLKGTDLVVLSACDTATVGPENTMGISSLGKAFIQAGAKDVVMSLWSVDDKETANLMTTFYQAGQKENVSYSEALRQSKLKMIKAGMHPYYWAPFILSGM